jgi:hypothetical protein
LPTLLAAEGVNSSAAFSYLTSCIDNPDNPTPSQPVVEGEASVPFDDTKLVLLEGNQVNLIRLAVNSNNLFYNKYK